MSILTLGSKKKRRKIPNQRVRESKKKRKKIPNQRVGEKKKRKKKEEKVANGGQRSRHVLSDVSRVVVLLLSLI